MKDIITINDFTYKVDDKIIIDNISLSIKQNSWNTIMGPNGSGKSTLLKLLLGLIEGTGNINIDGIRLNKENKADIYSRVGVILGSANKNFVSEIVKDEVLFKLNNLNYSMSECEKKLDELLKVIDIQNILESNIDELSTKDKFLVCLASVIIDKPKILIIDESIDYLDPTDKSYVLKILKKLNTNMTIINITHDAEQSLAGDNIIIMNNGKIEKNGGIEEVLLDEKLFASLGIELPFMVELSHKLMSYSLVDKLIFDMKRMVDSLWK